MPAAIAGSLRFGRSHQQRVCRFCDEPVVAVARFVAAGFERVRHNRALLAECVRDCPCVSVPAPHGRSELKIPSEDTASTVHTSTARGQNAQRDWELAKSAGDVVTATCLALSADLWEWQVFYLTGEEPLTGDPLTSGCG
jgi:hypothetical protein